MIERAVPFQPCHSNSEAFFCPIAGVALADCITHTAIIKKTAFNVKFVAGEINLHSYLYIACPSRLITISIQWDGA